MEKFTLSVLVENKFGVLARVAGLFSARGYNINSLAVAETEDPALSRITMVVDADEKILEGGTAYLTDVGMTGPYDSIIGVLKEDILERFRTGLPVRFRTAKRGGELRAAVVGVDEETGRAASIRRIVIREED